MTVLILLTCSLLFPTVHGHFRRDRAIASVFPEGQIGIENVMHGKAASNVLYSFGSNTYSAMILTPTSRNSTEGLGLKDSDERMVKSTTKDSDQRMITSISNIRDNITVNCGMSVELPNEALLDEGKTLFGGCDGLKDVTARVSAKSIFSEFEGKVTFTLRSTKEDDTIPRLKAEVGHDHYGIGSSANPALIIDVGANVGDFCISAAKLYPQAQVLCAEPAPETYFLLLWNLAENRVPRVEVSSLGHADRPGVIPLHGALASGEGFVDFSYNPKKSQNANIGGGPRTVGDAAWRHVKVKAYDLGKMLSAANVKSVDVLKLDCEGCEFTLVPSLQEWVVSHDRLKMLVGEIHWHITHKEEQTLAPQMDPTDVQRFKDVMKQRGSPVHDCGNCPFP